MPYVVCAEEMESRWIAHVPDLPGCFAAHDERDEAIAGAQGVEAYIAVRLGRDMIRAFAADGRQRSRPSGSMSLSTKSTPRSTAAGGGR
jgi:hypothetical protein